jgi:hypothetical protein
MEKGKSFPLSPSPHLRHSSPRPLGPQPRPQRGSFRPSVPPPPRRGGPRARPRSPCPPSSWPWRAGAVRPRLWRGRPPAQPRCSRSALGLSAALPSAHGASARRVRGSFAARQRGLARACSRGARSALAWLAVPSARRIASCRG